MYTHNTGAAGRLRAPEVVDGGGHAAEVLAQQALDDGVADVVAFGRWFISNPDLPERIRTGAKLNRYVRDTFYIYEEDGYVDYPDMQGTYGAKGKYELMDQASIGASLATAKAAKARL